MSSTEPENHEHPYGKEWPQPSPERLTRGEVEAVSKGATHDAWVLARALLAAWKGVEAIQWGALTDFDEQYCTACLAIRKEGHREGCPVATALPAPNTPSSSC